MKKKILTSFGITKLFKVVTPGFSNPFSNSKFGYFYNLKDSKGGRNK